MSEDQDAVGAGVTFLAWLASYNFAENVLFADGTSQPRDLSAVAIEMPVFIGTLPGLFFHFYSYWYYQS